MPVVINILLWLGSGLKGYKHTSLVGSGLKGYKRTSLIGEGMENWHTSY